MRRRNDENDEDINTLYCEFKLPTLVGRTVPGFKTDFKQTSSRLRDTAYRSESGKAYFSKLVLELIKCPPFKLLTVNCVRHNLF